MTANRYAAIIARHRPTFGGVGQDVQAESAYVASHYRYYRHRRGMTATKALEMAKEMPAIYTQGREYYGTVGTCGAAMDGVRWIESTAANGFRFVGDACDLIGGRNVPTGYYTDADGQYSTLRAGVWQLPGKGRHARLVAGYREYDGRTETNEGSARLDLSTVYLVPMDSDGDLTGADETRDAAIAADGMAESDAETERDYNLAYEAGRKVAETDNEMIEARRALLPVLAEFRLVRRGRLILSELLCDMLQKSVRDGLATIDEKREAVANAWGNCPSCDESAWLSGFMDESAGGFVRAVRMGWLKSSDWKGDPSENPCNRKAAA